MEKKFAGCKLVLIVIALDLFVKFISGLFILLVAIIIEIISTFF